jgi:hypothetical protein
MTKQLQSRSNIAPGWQWFICIIACCGAVAHGMPASFTIEFNAQIRVL